MGRWRVLAATASLLVLVGISAWLCAAEARGALPPGNFTPASIRVWPLTAAHANAIREDAIRHAAVRVPDPRGGTAASPPDSAPLTCLYLHDQPSGTSAKFDCVLDDGAVIKVKYGRNPEIHAEAAATRLLGTLGFPADEVTIVRRLRCYGCPRFPFFMMQLLSFAALTELLAPHGYDNAYTDFEWVSVERKFPAPAIETDMRQGWAWHELERSEAPRADLDALRLLAVFLAHWDNKSENQRLVCLDDLPPVPDQPCLRPLAMIQDLGSTFGPAKVNLARWRDMPVWADRRRCEVAMRALPFEGATFPPARISEEGRQLLARQLASIQEDEVRELFATARFAEFHSATDDGRDLQAWVAAFRHRADQIVMAGPCE